MNQNRRRENVDDCWFILEANIVFQKATNIVHLMRKNVEHWTSACRLASVPRARKRFLPWMSMNWWFHMKFMAYLNMNTSGIRVWRLVEERIFCDISGNLRDLRKQRSKDQMCAKKRVRDAENDGVVEKRQRKRDESKCVFMWRKDREGESEKGRVSERTSKMSQRCAMWAHNYRAQIYNPFMSWSTNVESKTK